MENNILNQTKAAIEQLLECGTCCVCNDIAAKIAKALNTLGVCVCGGMYDADKNLRYLYIDK